MQPKKLYASLLSYFLKKLNLKQINLYKILFACSWRAQKSSGSPNGIVYVFRAFVYNAIGINNIIVISSTKPTSHPYAQVAEGFK